MTYNLDRTPLSDLCEAIVDCEHKTAPKQDFGIPSIRTTDIKNGRLDIENANRVSEETYIQWTARLEPQPNDLILAREAPVGEVGIVPLGQRVCLGQRTVLIRPDKNKLFPRYLLYLLLTSQMRHALTSRAEGSVVPHLNMSAIRGLELPLLPPLDEQKAIAHILGTLDDKIELNQQMNQTLEAIAHALFKSWFIDFDPVRAKLDGRQPIGMDAETAALFPAEFEDSALGNIPKEWNVGVIDNLIDILSGGTPKTSVPEYWEGNIPWFSVKDAPTDSNVYVLETEKYITEAGVNNSSTQILSEGATIVSARGTVGRLALVGVPMAMNQSCYGIKGKEGYPDLFTYYFLHSAIVSLQQQTHGTVFETITRQTFTTVKSINPPAAIAQAFNKAVQPSLHRVRSNLFEVGSLTSIRDALLPKLLSGEIRVQDAEKLVEAVT